jgi:hypothetical protein
MKISPLECGGVGDILLRVNATSAPRFAAVVVSAAVALFGMRGSAAAEAVNAGSAPPLAGARTAPSLTAGALVTIEFPDLPATYHSRSEKNPSVARMTIFLPRNYDPRRKHPLLLFLNGGDGGDAANPGVARSLTQEKDFICVVMPLFKATDPSQPGDDIMREPDCQYMWPSFRTMLDKLDVLVPNIDPDHRVLGGFSNGAHATQGLIDASDGEVARRFSAFLFVEGGGRLRRYDLLKGKPYLMVSSNAKSRPRAQQLCDAATAAGAKATLVFVDVGHHDFPPAAYPAVREWLRQAVTP